MSLCNASSRLAVLMLALAAARATAAVQLKGSIADENGVPVSGVTIEVKSPGGSAQHAYSDNTGHFEVLVPTPGEYLVSLSKPDYFRLTDQPVPLQEGTNEVSFTLSHEFEVHESVEVRSSTKQIEPLQTEHQETFDAQDILDIPAYSTHDLAAYLPAIAGVVQDNSGAIHVAGGRSGDAEYLLDGFEIGDPVTGELTSRLDIDSVREVQVASGRYGSQYAHAAGAVMELNTYVGDDRWRFGTTDFFPAVNLQQGLHLGNWYPRFNFSGPLHKGRAWFSDGISIQHTFSLIQGLPRNADTQQQWSGDNLFRVQMNLTPTNILQGNFLYNLTADSHLGLSLFTPLSTTTDLHAQRAFVSAKDQVFFGRNMFELGAAIDDGTGNNEPLGSEPYIVQPLTASGNYFQGLRQRSHRLQSIGHLNLSSLRWHGTHEVKAGFNADGLAFSQGAARNPIETLRADNTLLLRTTFSGTPYYRVTNTQLGSYLQDSWRVFRPLVVTIGGRADWDTLVGKTVLGPRLAANLLPFRDDRTKISAGWGIYYRPINVALWGAGLDQERSDTLYDPTGTTPLGTFITQFLLPSSGLRQARFNTSNVEWEQKLGSNTSRALLSCAVWKAMDSLTKTSNPLPREGWEGCFCFRTTGATAIVPARFGLAVSSKTRPRYMGIIRAPAPAATKTLDYSLLNPLFCSPGPGTALVGCPESLDLLGVVPYSALGLIPELSGGIPVGLPVR